VLDTPEETDTFRPARRVGVHNLFVFAPSPWGIDEGALQRRLGAIGRRQALVVSLLVGGYVLVGVRVLVEQTAAVTVWNAGVGVAVFAVVAPVVGAYRRRRARG
jgi:hypothetical protein